MKAISESLPCTDGWHERADKAFRRWLGKETVRAAWLGLLVALLCPPRGIPGVSLCWFKATTGLPCPGCGLIRSLSCGFRGMFIESWTYHPMGLAILALVLFLAAFSLLPAPQRDRVIRLVRAHAAFFNALYLAFIVCFVAFGIARTLLQLAGICRFAA